MHENRGDHPPRFNGRQGWPVQEELGHPAPAQQLGGVDSHQYAQEYVGGRGAITTGCSPLRQAC